MSDPASLAPTAPIYPLTYPADRYFERFQDPPRSFAPLPLWFWNAQLDLEVLLAQLGSIDDAGCRGAIIYPRHGLRTPYLSEEWMHLVGAVSKEARTRGLEIWLADSENWPGGVGPDSGQASYVRMLRFSAGGGELHTFYLPGQILGVAAVAGDQEATAEMLDLGPLVEGATLRWTPPDARRWSILAFGLYRYEHADLLGDGSGERLLQSTHRRYEMALGDLREAGIAGFFTDEASPLSIWSVPEGPVLPWTGGLLGDRGDGIERLEALVSLAIDRSDSWKVRQQFWSALADRYQRAFFEPVRRWLEDRGLRWAGHLLFEEPMLDQAAVQGDFPRLLKNFDLPVVDNLLLRAPGAEQNLVASLAHRSGRPAASESFGGSGWGVTLEDRRRSFDLQLAHGIDRLIPNGIFYSSAGKRKIDAPPSEFIREPFAPAYPLFARHVQRLCWAMSQGRGSSPVALFYPLRSAWATRDLEEEPLMAQAVEDDFLRIAALLDQLQYEYEILDQALLSEAEVVGDRLRVAGGDYAILVLPSCPCIGRESWQKLLEFFDSGGRVLCLGMLPEGFEDGPDPSLAGEILRLAAFEVEPIRRAYLMQARNSLAGQEVYTFTRKNPSGGRFSAFPYALSPDPVFAFGEARQLLHSYAPPEVDCRQPEVRVRRRSLGGLDLYWVVSTASAPLETRLVLRSHGAPEIWDPLTGERHPIYQYSWVSSDQTVISLRLLPEQGMLIAVPPEEVDHLDAANFVVRSIRASDESIAVEGYADADRAVCANQRLVGSPQAVWKPGRDPVYLESPPNPPVPRLDLDGEWQIHLLDPDVLILDEWRYRRDERGGGRLLLWQRRAHPDWDLLHERKPLGWRPELEAIESDLTAHVWYQTGFTANEWRPDTPLWLLLETIDAPFRCWVDGTEVEPSRTNPFVSGVHAAGISPILDPGYRWVDLTGTTGTGHHVVVLLADHRELPPVRPPSHRHRIPIDLVPSRARLVGSFSTLERPRGPAISSRLPPGARPVSWTEFGYPHYSGMMSYRRRVEIPSEFRGAAIFLEMSGASGPVDVRIDGQLAGTIPWSPWRLEIGDHIVPGTVELELIIANTASNALLGRRDPSGILGALELAAYPRVRLEGSRPRRAGNQPD